MESNEAQTQPPEVVDDQKIVTDSIRDVILVFQKQNLTQGQYLIVLQCLTAGALSTENSAVMKNYLKLLEREVKRHRKLQIANRPAQGSA